MIGEKIRNIRKAKKLTIVELSEQISVTSGYISQIERDLISPSLSVLKRLSEALDVPLSELFLEENSHNVVKIQENDRTKVKFCNLNVELEYITPVINNGDKPSNLEAFLFKLRPGTWLSENALASDGKSCIYVLSGEIQSHVGNNVYTLCKGDSISVPENSGHMIFNCNNEDSEALCIVSPAMR